MSEMITDPEQIAQLAKQFVAEEVVNSVTTELPTSNEVTLPGGFITAERAVVKTAQIRELNGEDEEALAAISSPARALNTVLSRGLVKLGDTAVTASDLDNLLVGDREAILLGIRIATFGETLSFEWACSACSKEQQIELNLKDDITTVELADPVNDRVFSVKAKAGDVVLSLPNGVTAKRVVDLEDASIAETVTAILAGCVVSVNGEPSMGVRTARTLGMADRELLIGEIYDRSPGPRLGEVAKACKACGENIPLPLSLASLFRL